MTPSSPAFDPIVYIFPFTSCGDGAIPGCYSAVNLFGPGFPEAASFTNLAAPQAVIVVVDTFSPFAPDSDYTIHASVTP